MMSLSDIQPPRQGLLFARWLMTFSSLSPLFILWAVRGTELIPDIWFIPGCLAIVFLPTWLLYKRIQMAKKQNDTREIVVGSVDDHRSHVLVYLFAILLPFYREELATYRDLSAMILALAFITFLFWHLNLYYINFFFALLGYRVFMISPPMDENPYTGREPFVLITYKRCLASPDCLTAYRLSDTVYLELKT